MRWILVPMLAAVLSALGPTRAVADDEAEKAAEPSPTVVLHTAGFWRVFETLRPPVFDTGDRLKPALVNVVWLDWATADPPDRWTAPDFDDAAWRRAPSLAFSHTPYLARHCLRGKFRVTDPKAVRDLKVSLGYYGGAVVTLNGREVARRHLPEGPITPETVAEAYPVEAFLSAGGEVLNSREHQDEESRRRFGLRPRELGPVEIPARFLRKGVNVLAVEVRRAAYPKVLDGLKGPRKDLPYELRWGTCRLRRVQLIAASAAGLEPNATRPAGLQVWNSELLQDDYDLDFGDPLEPLRPVRLMGAAGGSFSGKVVVGRDGPIRNLRADAGKLTGPGGTVPAGNVRVRYAHPWGGSHVRTPYSDELPPYPRSPRLLGALVETPREEYPVVAREPDRYHSLDAPNQPEPVFGAVVPVWVTVRTPRSLAAGTYRGALTIRAEGVEAVRVPVELEVADWTVPEPKDFRTWVEMVQSPDTLAVEYDVPLWSEAHWQLIERALRLTARVGDRSVYVPLVCHTNYGNEQSMVRWIPRGDGRYDYDFSVMERYLDLAQKHLGALEVVVFNVWEVYMVPKSKSGARGQEERAIAHLKKHGGKVGEPPAVTVLGAGGREARTVHLPPYAADRSRALWEPLVRELRERMARRDLAEAMMLGTVSDANPTREELRFWREVSGDLPWIVHSHHGRSTAPDYRLGGEARIGYQTRVWNISFGDGLKSEHGWKRDLRIADYERHANLESLPTAYWWHLAEFNIIGDHRGIGRLGADIWPAVKDGRGRRKGTVAERYPQSARRNLDMRSAALAPGPDGPVATTRFELFRQNVQQCEARIVIERALVEPALRARLGDELAARCEAVLQGRVKRMFKGLCTLRLASPHWNYAWSWRGNDDPAGNFWFLGLDTPGHTRTLYELAGEVARKLQGV